jgi:uncharacterized membrane protein
MTTTATRLPSPTPTGSQASSWKHVAIRFAFIVGVVLALTLGAYLLLVGSVTHLGYATSFHRTWLYLVPGNAIIATGVFVALVRGSRRAQQSDQDS